MHNVTNYARGTLSLKLFDKAVHYYANSLNPTRNKLHITALIMIHKGLYYVSSF